MGTGDVVKSSKVLDSRWNSLGFEYFNLSWESDWDGKYGRLGVVSYRNGKFIAMTIPPMANFLAKEIRDMVQHKKEV
jgi:hypothetical protein